MKFRERPEWIRGDAVQKQCARLLGRCTNALVLPCYGAEGVELEDKAPILYRPAGSDLVVPDIMLLRRGAAPRWLDVKAKSQPSWHRINGRWEHGCDYSIAEQYRAVEQETGYQMWIVLREEYTPLNSHADSALLGPSCWRTIALADAFRLGQHRADWPGGKRQPNRRGRDGKGGLLWDRNDMQQLHTMTQAEHTKQENGRCAN
jgi:hypothetical protein